MSNTITYKNYIGSVEYSQEDNIFHGKINGVNDLVTFEGESVSQLKSEFRKAVEDYVELCKIAGKSPEKSYKGSFNVRITPDLHKELSKQSIKQGLSLNQLVEFAIKEKLKRLT